MKKCEVISICTQKGGAAKTTTASNLAVGLVCKGKKVCCIDMDPQASLTMALGVFSPSTVNTSIAGVLKAVLCGETVFNDCIIKTKEGVDLVPANINLSAFETQLANEIGRERILKSFVDEIRKNYDFIIIDCMPFMGMLTINALVASDSVIIPTEPEYISAKGIQQLIETLYVVKKRMNPRLKVKGILLTMGNYRTIHAREVKKRLKRDYSKKIKIFKTNIPRSVRVCEASVAGMSIYSYAPGNPVAKAYAAFTDEVLNNA